MDNYVITISRQFASMGRTISQKLSKELGIEFYDRDIVEAAAKRMGQSITVISNEEEAKPKFFRRLYPLGMGVANMQDEIYNVQSNIIRDYADKESCIIVGRNGNTILSDHDKALHVYIYASYEQRYDNCINELQMKPKNASRMLKDVDKARDTYHKRYSKGIHNMYDGYDIMIDSGRFGIDGTVKLLAGIIRERFE